MQTVINVEQLSKSYGNLPVIEDRHHLFQNVGVQLMKGAFLGLLVENALLTPRHIIQILLPSFLSL